MVNDRIVEKPAFDVIGRKTFISGQDNELFGKLWAQCTEEGLFETFELLSQNQPGMQTKSSVLGISCVEKDPDNRAFYYLIGIEKPVLKSDSEQKADELETYHVPASRWAVFECKGKYQKRL
jgi:AraC family transcriptional regulator